MMFYTSQGVVDGMSAGGGTVFITYRTFGNLKVNTRGRESLGIFSSAGAASRRQIQDMQLGSWQLVDGRFDLHSLPQVSHKAPINPQIVEIHMAGGTDVLEVGWKTSEIRLNIYKKSQRRRR
jgi:hypothetical protein